jgi:hypothetical protein
MTRPADLLMHSRQNVALAYRRAADAALAVAEAWSTVQPGVIAPDQLHRHVQDRVDLAQAAVVNHDAAAAGTARGRQ